ncbi:MAG: helix-turn-helix domain-containing protein [Gammaproteobacteria bacterium]|nr:helix-turn-helix domain-containing protein [Gammaproteobacteria bacterium]MDH5727738.1 helix-turn-helix domain-containing protein [Gammaproteobacteria bacterium]
MESTISRNTVDQHELAPALREIVEDMLRAVDEGPGDYLRRARETLGLSIYEVAAQLSVPNPQVKLLEGNDFENLPAPIFVRNYIRRYADLLGMPADEVVACYERVGVEEMPSLARVSLRQRLNDRHQSMRWASFSAVALIMLLLFFWWQSMPNESRNDIEMPAETAGGEIILQLPEIKSEQNTDQ